MKQHYFQKRIFFFFIAAALLVGNAANVSAQWVHIPDANFRAKIATLAPGSIAGDSMNTADAGVINLQHMDVSYRLISDLTGIQYFPNLLSLSCSGNNLSDLNNLPDDLIVLHCNYNKLTSLPSPLPSTLTELYCDNNLLTSLPDLPDPFYVLYCYKNPITQLPTLPSSITTIDCSDNDLTVLPDLPASLTYLVCTNNRITVLPDLPPHLGSLSCNSNQLNGLPPLPSGLSFLDCGYNDFTQPLPDLPLYLVSLNCISNSLTSLPTLPESITDIDCALNFLTAIPDLPSGLATLYCDYNLLDSLPTLPPLLKSLNCNYNPGIQSLPVLPPGLYRLYCHDDGLTVLPALPSSSIYLACSSNHLTSLPPLPSSLFSLDCSDNSISCLPLLPESMTYLTGINAGYTCLPNIPAALINILGPDSLCAPGNSPCNIYPVISGSLYNDDNLNAVLDNNETGHPNVIIHIQPGNYLFATGDSAHYSYVVDTGAAYTITPNAIPYYNAVPASQSTPVLSLAMADSLNNFALQRVGIVHDLNVEVTSLTRARRDAGVGHAITVVNNGTVNDIASLQYVFDPQLTYLGSSPPADVVNGDTMQWNNIDLTPGKKKDFSVSFHIDNSVPLSTDLYSYATVNPVAGDTTPADNVDTLHQVVVGSYDPNELEVDPPGSIWVAQVKQGQWIDYIVRFQNTGNADALKVEIRDTLSSKLDLSTLQIISSSHQMTWNVQHSVAYFEFDHINLPDSNASEVNSHGFVRYRIQADTTLEAGEVIENTADIYFDANSPIVTNTALNHIIEQPLAVNTAHAGSSDLLLYPNPAGDRVYFNSKTLTGKYELTVFDLSGRVLLSNSEINGRAGSVDISNLSRGIYFLQLKTERSYANGRFVKE